MFNWDDDIDALCASHARLQEDPSRKNPRRSGRWKQVPVVAILGASLWGGWLAFGGTSAESANADVTFATRLSSAFDTGQNSVGSVALLGAEVGEPVRQAITESPRQMPDELVFYDRAQFERFTRGISRFSDTELMDYAAATIRDLDVAPGAMVAAHMDVLLLIIRDAERRGMPVSGLRAAYDQRRAQSLALMQF